MLSYALQQDSVAACAAEAAIYKADGSTLRSFSMPVKENPQCVRVFRDEIALCIIKAAQRLYPEAIHFHFNTPIEKVDLDTQAVYVFTAGSTTEVRYDQALQISCLNQYYARQHLRLFASALRCCIASYTGLALSGLALVNSLSASKLDTMVACTTCNTQGCITNLCTQLRAFDDLLVSVQ